MDLHALLAAGAAAGLAAAFNAPLAAVLFVIEETRKQFRYTFRSYVAVIVASAGSAFGMELVGGAAPQLQDRHRRPAADAAADLHAAGRGARRRWAWSSTRPW